MNFDSYTDGSVGKAVDLVNTADEPDELADPAALEGFLARHRDSYDRPVTSGDLDAVRALREQLREVFDSTDMQHAAGLLNDLLRDAGALPQLTDHDGRWHFHYTPAQAPLVDRLAAETAMALSVVLGDHGLERLRVCAAADCADVFVDTSRNRSRRYCDPAVCGNRANVAAYRARQRSSAG